MKYKVFDAHTDILYDVLNSYDSGDKSRFNDFHDKELSGNIKGGIWTLYSPNEFDLLERLKISLPLINRNKYEVILGLESLRNLKSINELKEIYNLGFRHAMLTWNEENDYATGVAGDINRGVTKRGYEVLDFMIEHDMIIDLSHLNEKSFYDVLKYTNKNILVSHSNIKELCDHRRNLSMEQLKMLKEVNGLLGLTLVGGFISSNDENRNLDMFIKHLDYAINIMGIDNICFGFDFMNYFGYSKTANLEEVRGASDINNLIKKLEEKYSNIEIEKMLYKNIVDRFGRHIGLGL